MTCTRSPDIVRVKPGLTPSTGWGSALASSEGPVVRIREEYAHVDFPEHSDWVGLMTEIEVVRRREDQKPGKCANQMTCTVHRWNHCLLASRSPLI